MLRIIILLLLTIHGLIHLMGFVKAFQYAEMKQLTGAISKSIGALWLLAALLFIISTLLLVLNKNAWAYIVIPTIVVSQLVIIGSWHDAKFGTIANVIILMAAVIGFATGNYYQNYKRDVTKGLQQNPYFQNSLLTEADIQQLPEPVKKYIRYTGSIGRLKVNHFQIKLNGKIRKNEQSEWMPFTSEQRNFMETPTRLFFMKAANPKDGVSRSKDSFVVNQNISFSNQVLW